MAYIIVILIPDLMGNRWDLFPLTMPGNVPIFAFISGKLPGLPISNGRKIRESFEALI